MGKTEEILYLCYIIIVILYVGSNERSTAFLYHCGVLSRADVNTVRRKSKSNDNVERCCLHTGLGSQK